MDHSTDVFDWLDSHVNLEKNQPEAGRPAGYDPDARLASAKRLYELLDDPQLKFQSIHVTGTNGKTSTARIATNLMLAMGVRTGSYTSPHLQTLNERICVNAEPVPDRELVDALESIRLLEMMLDESPTYFEIITAAGFRVLADAPVDAAVVEVGLGGTYDSTNAIDAPVCIITNIGDDHQNFLGPTRAHIAEQKAGIIREGAVVVTSETDPEMLEIFERRNPAKLLVAGRDFDVVTNKLAVGGRLLGLRTATTFYEDKFLSLHGSHQGVNAAVALTAVEEFFGQPLPEDAVREGLGTVAVPGRMEIMGRSPLTIIDGAHNADAATKLTAALDEEFGATRGRIVVIGMLSPHDPAEMLEALQVSRARLVIACRAPSPRAVEPEAIAEAAMQFGAPSVVVEDIDKALEEALSAADDESVVLVTGSLYVVGAARDSLTS